MNSRKKQPTCYVIGGPNGAGKTSVSLRVLPRLDYMEYVNADAIAAALSPFQPEKSALKAGRMMLQRIHKLADQRADFAFETTLASRSFAPFLKRRKEEGYQVVLFYFYLKTPELAVSRVAERVLAGGHHIPEADIRRRYRRSLQNLRHLYQPLADAWGVYDNSDREPVSTEASTGTEPERLTQLSAWIKGAISEAVEINRKLGTPIYVFRDGQVVDISKELPEQTGP
ncbi:MAG: zeta toxin family protein [Vampirovibrionales bacterium]|nr:zeta toxin family protein [Vampirovibrionales bacterium]